MDIKNVNSTMNLEKPSPQAAKLTSVNKNENAENKDDAVRSNLGTKKGIVSDVELQAILENLASSESKVVDVEKADEMIREANKKILASKEEAILTQANQSKDVVEKLTK